MSPREIADVTGCTSVSLGATSGRHLVQVHINCELARNVTGNLHLVTLSQGPIETGMMESGQVPSPDVPVWGTRCTLRSLSGPSIVPG